MEGNVGWCPSQPSDSSSPAQPLSPGRRPGHAGPGRTDAARQLRAGWAEWVTNFWSDLLIKATITPGCQASHAATTALEASKIYRWTIFKIRHQGIDLTNDRDLWHILRGQLQTSVDPVRWAEWWTDSSQPVPSALQNKLFKLIDTGSCSFQIVNSIHWQMSAVPIFNTALSKSDWIITQATYTTVTVFMSSM